MYVGVSVGGWYVYVCVECGVRCGLCVGGGVMYVCGCEYRVGIVSQCLQVYGICECRWV